MKTKATLHVPLLADTLMERELELERNSAEEGASRYEAMSDAAIQRREGAQLRPAERMCAMWYAGLKQELTNLKASVAIGKAGKGRNIYGPVLAASNIKAATAITLHQGMSLAMMSPRGHPLAQVAYAIGNAVIADIHMRVGKKRKADMKQLTYHIRKFATQIPRKVNRWAKENLEDHAWSRKVCGHLGLALAWRLVGAAVILDEENNPHPAFGVERRIRNNRTENWLYLRPEIQQLISEAQVLRAAMRPKFGPMVVPPLHWSKREDGSLEEGGHYRLRTPFVVNPSASLRTRLKSASIDSVFTAVNNLSSVAWQVDPFIKETVSAIMEAGGGIAGLPRADPIPIPDKPTGLDGLKEWRQQAAMTHEANAKLFSARQDLILALGVADDLVEQQAIWFPHQLDFRGRAYPVPLHLNHIGEDPRRAMLRFARAVPVNDDRWLKIHAANCWGQGIDKASFSERVAWVDRNVQEIERFQRSPLVSEGWMAAESPFQFLAACRALCDSTAAARLPVHQDGSCNGLQQYAAMGLDAAGGASVNLMASERPSDVYAAVAAVVARRIEEHAAAGVPQAIALRGKIDRKVVKQNVMTSVYGVTRSGASNQLQPRLIDKGIARADVPKMAHWLSRVVLDSIGEACRGAGDMMAWLRQATRVILEDDAKRPIEWTTPMGFPVLQPYWNTRKLEIGVESAKFTIHLRSPVEDDRQQVHKCINGAAPNFVHSVDSTHMMMTSNACAAAGIDFAAVHDSFWSHAANSDALARTLREQFIVLHSQDLAENLRMQWMNRYGVTLDPVPEKGSLRIGDVLRSEYFFA